MAGRMLPRPALGALLVAVAACGDRSGWGRGAGAEAEPSDPEVVADLAYHDSLSVSLIDFEVARGAPGIALTLEIGNLGSRAVRAARGVFLVEDVYGEALARFRVDYPDSLAPGETVTAKYFATSAQPVPVPVARRLEELGARNVGVVSTWNRLAWPDGHQSTARIYMTMARGEGAYRPGSYPEINLVRER